MIIDESIFTSLDLINSPCDVETDLEKNNIRH
jgi:hypothetical protein